MLDLPAYPSSSPQGLDVSPPQFQVRNPAPSPLLLALELPLLQGVHPKLGGA
jgi:hypothetical protein